MAGMNDTESSAQAHLTRDVTNRNVNDVSDNVPTVVVNELLCFVNQKINLLPSETVIQLCVKHDKPDEIEMAKRKLFKVCPSDSRMLTRKGLKKNVQNLEDVVKRMNKLDSAVDVIPCFLARDLGNLPPITFDSLDVPVLLTKIESLNDEVLLMRGAMKCQQITSEALTKVCSERQYPECRSLRVKCWESGPQAALMST